MPKNNTDEVELRFSTNPNEMPRLPTVVASQRSIPRINFCSPINGRIRLYLLFVLWCPRIEKLVKTGETGPVSPIFSKPVGEFEK
jgi:hypothetical protein